MTRKKTKGDNMHWDKFFPLPVPTCLHGGSSASPPVRMEVHPHTHLSPQKILSIVAANECVLLIIAGYQSCCIIIIIHCHGNDGDLIEAAVGYFVSSGDKAIAASQ